MRAGAASFPIFSKAFIANRRITGLESLKDSQLEVHLVEKEILVSFRKKAELTIFSTQKLKEVSVKINGKFYEAFPVDKKMKRFHVDIHDISRPGRYYADILAENNVIAEKVAFSVKKEGLSTNDLF